MEDTSIDDLQHAANWTAVTGYLETVTLDTLEVHIQLRSESRPDPDM